MSNLLEWKKQLQQIYTQYSMYIDKGIRFLLALTAFLLVNTQVGFMEKLANPIITIGLALVCTFLPLTLTVIASVGLMLVHMFSLSMIIAAIVGVILLLMFIFYFRFTPNKAFILILTPAAFALKVPVLIPVTLGLTGNPILAIPAAFGTVLYYLMKFTKDYAGAMNSASDDNMVNVAIGFAKQIMTNKEMWFAVAAIVLSLVFVYLIRKISMTYAWAVAGGAGALIYIVVLITGNVVFDIKVDYLTLILGSIAALIVGVVLELFVFSVDYSRTERLQFEDDEYYYYVKAVPKLSVPNKDKRVKRINRRQDSEADERAREKKEAREAMEKKHAPKQPVKTPPLNDEVDLDKLIEEELLK